MFFLNGKQIAKTLNQIHKCNNVPSVLLRSNHTGKHFSAPPPQIAKAPIHIFFTNY